jgi:dethiobiotin synthetase/adenosylmethionine--8-amino-7-oxononanoate aminotransferase
MAQLFKHTRIHQIFGANTNVGKTVLTTGVARAALKDQKSRVLYLKPVSTGPESEEDERSG